jgi:hypothetical protein
VARAKAVYVALRRRERVVKERALSKQTKHRRNVISPIAKAFLEGDALEVCRERETKFGDDATYLQPMSLHPYASWALNMQCWATGVRWNMLQAFSVPHMSPIVRMQQYPHSTSTHSHRPLKLFPDKRPSIGSLSS